MGFDHHEIKHENRNVNKDENQIEKEKIENECLQNPNKNLNLRGLIRFGANSINAICKIKILNNSYGTGFFCKIPYPDDEHILKVLITNNHVINENYLRTKKNIELIVNNRNIILPLSIRKMWTNIYIDYTVIEILSSDNINNFLVIDEKINQIDFRNKEYENASIILPTFMQNGEIETDKGNIIGIAQSNFYHNCNTEKGSSGGPIILIDNYSVIGIHKGCYKGNKKNIGIFMKNIINDIKDENIIKKSFLKPIDNSEKTFSMKDFRNFGFHCPLCGDLNDYWYLANSEEIKKYHENNYHPSPYFLRADCAIEYLEKGQIGLKGIFGCYNCQGRFEIEP